MEGSCNSTSSSLLLRNRRVENLEMSCFGSSKTSVSSVFNGGKSVEIERDYRNRDGCWSSFDDSRDGSVDDDGWGAVVVSIVRIVTCFVTMMFTTFFWGVLMVLLLPWPYARIRQGNVYGHVTGRLLMWILGNPIKIEGAEFSNTRGIYICNHASPLDIFLIMWLTPTGTVGIAKKEIIYYPLFGQLYVLANHLRIDRSNPAAAIESMKEVARAIVKRNLSLVLFPEGTRSKTGRLLPFKKNFSIRALFT
ncbi:hypothetical protein Scep_028769 [Stephania cephalantha]|uniref:Phospholipid/glycerol acyltransferase domain-containing protein n=1 Tax=Stephania cephalantha TaxID=152367 RepID=A0AAP0EF51_9MAGN